MLGPLPYTPHAARDNSPGGASPRVRREDYSPAGGLTPAAPLDRDEYDGSELAGLPVKFLIFPNTVAPPAFRCYRRHSSSPRPPASAMAHSDQPALHRFSFES